jgi:hypothetical protein
LSYQARSPVARRPNMNLPLAQVGVSLFSPKESLSARDFSLERAYSCMMEQVLWVS